MAVPRPPGGLASAPRLLTGDTTPEGRWKGPLAPCVPVTACRAIQSPRKSFRSRSRPASQRSAGFAQDFCSLLKYCPGPEPQSRRRSSPVRLASVLPANPALPSHRSHGGDPGVNTPRPQPRTQSPPPPGAAQGLPSARPPASLPGTRRRPPRGRPARLLCPEGLVSVDSKLSGHSVGFQKNTQISET